MKRKSMTIRLALVLSVILMLIPGTAFGSLDNKGTEFILAFLPNYDNYVTIQLHLVSSISTNVTVEYPVSSPTFVTTVAVNPGNVTVVTLPDAAATGWTTNVPQNNAVRASAPDEFVVYMVNLRDMSSDAALALPVDTMNTDYIVVDYQDYYKRAEFNVYAAYDNTTVTVTPSQNMVGYSAGVPFNVVLNRGQGVMFQSAVSTGPESSLTGTIVSADRPVGMANGNGCTLVPPGTTACDHIFEVAQPVQTWGTDILVENLPQRPYGSVYRVVASEDNTNVTQDGILIGTLNKGQFIETAVIAGSHAFSGDKPIYVTQYMTGDSYPGAVQGDPAMGNMIPYAQYLHSYTFSTVGGDQFATNYVSIIAENADVGTLTLDGVPVPAAYFAPIGASGFSAAVVQLSQGVHATVSNGVHGITVEGFNSYDSYIYPGGALFQFINPVGDTNPPIITLVTDPGPPPEANGTATDNRPSEDTNSNGLLDPGEDLNGNGLIDEDTGIFFVELDVGAANLVLTVDPFVPGDGTVNFTVSLSNPLLPGSGTIRVTDGAGNESSEFVELIPVLNEPPVADADGPYSGDEGSPIALDGTGSSDPDDDPLTYAWSVDSALCSLDDATSLTPNLTCADNGNFAVTLVVDDGQATDSDTAAVTVYNVAPAVSIDSVSPTLIAVGETIQAAGSFTDPGTNDTHTAVWDWGDGTTAGTVSGLNVGPDSHTYGAAGIYTIQLAVTDDDGGVGMAAYEFVVVYDPSAGFVTGGGWIDSPAGAYVPDPDLTGKATFGFVSKYKKGATIPTGNTEFQFHAANLNFHSSSYQWLVVTGSDYARFKGVGTINGEGEYKFLLWAGDSDPDTFRIKIWTEDELGVETVVYDNGFDQPLGSGSIIIHTK